MKTSRDATTTMEESVPLLGSDGAGSIPEAVPVATPGTGGFLLDGAPISSENDVSSAANPVGPDADEESFLKDIDEVLLSPEPKLDGAACHEEDDGLFLLRSTKSPPPLPSQSPPVLIQPPPSLPVLKVRTQDYINW